MLRLHVDGDDPLTEREARNCFHRILLRDEHDRRLDLIQDGAFTPVITFGVIAAFIVAALFEIKKLVDQPSVENRH
jgi:hypothetical protein